MNVFLTELRNVLLSWITKGCPIKYEENLICSACLVLKAVILQDNVLRFIPYLLFPGSLLDYQSGVYHHAVTYVVFAIQGVLR